MPLYDCVLLLKPNVTKQACIDLVSKIGRHVSARNGVVTDMASFGEVQLGYGVKKRYVRFYEGTLMQITMMATPNMNKELHYLNKEDRLLRWLLVKHRDTSAWMNQEINQERDSEISIGKIGRKTFWDAESSDDDHCEEDNVIENDENTEQ